MSVFEAAMLISCFGVSWPISIAKSLRTKVVAGESTLFMVIVCGLGYLWSSSTRCSTTWTGWSCSTP